MGFIIAVVWVTAWVTRVFVISMLGIAATSCRRDIFLIIIVLIFGFTITGFIIIIAIIFIRGIWRGSIRCVKPYGIYRILN